MSIPESKTEVNETELQEAKYLTEFGKLDLADGDILVVKWKNGMPKPTEFSKVQECLESALKKAGRERVQIWMVYNEVELGVIHKD